MMSEWLAVCFGWQMMHGSPIAQERAAGVLWELTINDDNKCQLLTKRLLRVLLKLLNLYTTKPPIDPTALHARMHAREDPKN